MVNLFSMRYNIGAIQFVVHDAAENMLLVSISSSFELIPYTIFGMPFPGAVNNTLLTPLAFR